VERESDGKEAERKGEKHNAPPGLTTLPGKRSIKPTPRPGFRRPGHRMLSMESAPCP
jgi:hypothetical protein